MNEEKENSTIEGLEVREWRLSDVEGLYYLLEHYDRTYSYTGYPEPESYERGEVVRILRSNINMELDGYGISRAIVLDGKVVGDATIQNGGSRLDACCDFSIMMLPEVRGRGVDVAALRKMIDVAFNGSMNFEVVHVRVPENNDVAVRMCEAVGMQCIERKETDFRDADGNIIYSVLYGIRRPKKAIARIGVELKPWERCDIVELVHLLDTVDGRYDEITRPGTGLFIVHRLRGMEPPTEEEVWRYQLENAVDMVDRWNVSERKGEDMYRAILSDGEIVGLVSVRVQPGNRRVDGLLGYMMMPEHCNKGIATQAVRLMADEAFHQRGYHRISAQVYAPNKASVRVLEKNGFRLEGVVVEGVMCENEPNDYLYYGLLDREFYGRLNQESPLSENDGDATAE